VRHFADRLTNAVVRISTHDSQLLQLRVLSDLRADIGPAVGLAVANRQTIREVSDISEVLLPDQPTRHDKMLGLGFGFLR